MSKIPKGMQMHRCLASEIIPFQDYLLRKCLNGHNRNGMLDWEIDNNLSCEFDKHDNITWYWNENPMITILNPVLKEKKYAIDTQAILFYIIHHKLQ